MRTVLRWVFTVLATLAVLVGIASVVLHFLPVTNPHLVGLAAFAQPVAVAPLVGVLLFLVLRRGFGMFAAVLTTACCVLVQLPMILGSPASDRGVVLTVMQANIGLGQADPDALAKLVQDNHVDILAVSELTDSAATRLGTTAIGRELAYTATRPAPFANGTGLYSRYPLETIVSMEGYTLANLSAIAVVPGGGPVQLYGLHLVPPYPSSGAWTGEIARAQDTLAKVPAGRPAIALGDFNATWDNKQFRNLLGRASDGGRAGYTDAAEAVGARWLPTYPTDRWYPQLISIDHVLVRDAGVASVRSVALPGSDHRGVIARIPLG